jgi:hypothetical protein
MQLLNKAAFVATKPVVVLIIMGLADVNFMADVLLLPKITITLLKLMNMKTCGKGFCHPRFTKYMTVLVQTLFFPHCPLSGSQRAVSI